ncbi:MAG: dihydropteroate synthase [Terriglobia bacterium]
MSPRREFQIQLGGRTVTMGSRTLVMGVLNVTPDSFSDGGRYFDSARAVERGVQLAQEGADWIDVGGESTRPGAQPVPAEEELRRVLPVIRSLRRRLRRVPISIDTTKAEVAEQALDAGANVLNDISGLRFEPRLAVVASRYGAPLILMHSRNRPETMQRKPFTRDIWRSLTNGLETSIRRALAGGVKRSQLILDPGLGFGKSRRQNYQVLAGLEKLRRFHLPLLIGASRKSFVQAIVAGEELEPSRSSRPGARYWPIAAASRDERARRREPSKLGLADLTTGDAAAVVAAILGGAHIVRVHDPGAILPAARVADALLAALR